MKPNTTPKDFFLHLGAVIALYAGAIALINLAFTIVNYLHPDALAGYVMASSVAWPISMVVVLAPLLFVLEWALARDIRRAPEKREIWVRRWRVYLTLFLSGATVIGDLIVLINTYLSGEVTARFAWKVLIVLVIAGIVFAYYLLARSGDEKGRKARLALAWVAVAVALAAVIAGFVVVGSPWKQRQARFDANRISDILNIQSQVVGAWQRTGTVPASLDALKDPLGGLTVPNDPETGKPYEYSATGSRAFRICATFDLSSDELMSFPAPAGAYYGSYAGDTSYLPGGASAWNHPAGRACFDRTVDPARFPVNAKTVNAQ